MEWMDWSIAISMCRQDRMMSYVFHLLFHLFSCVCAIFHDIDNNPYEKLCTVVDDLKTEEYNKIPKLYWVQFSIKNSSILKTSHKKGKLKENDCGMIDSPIAKIENAS
jgi:hypothetical protein